MRVEQRSEAGRQTKVSEPATQCSGNHKIGRLIQFNVALPTITSWESTTLKCLGLRVCEKDEKGRKAADDWGRVCFAVKAIQLASWASVSAPGSYIFIPRVLRHWPLQCTHWHCYIDTTKKQKQQIKETIKQTYKDTKRKKRETIKQTAPYSSPGCWDTGHCSAHCFIVFLY